MSYPISVSRLSLDHKGGTKSYFLTLIWNADGQAIVIKRWGKTGAFGQMDVYRGTSTQCQKEFDKKLREKQNGGYATVNSSTEVVCDTLEEVIKAVGRPTWAKLEAADLQHLDPTVNTSGVRERDPVTVDESGKFLGHNEPRKIEITDEMRENDRLEKIRQARLSNPNYGRF